MSRFEEIGVDIQHNARTKQYAIRSFENSCNRCCYTGQYISCKCCAIAGAHNEMLNLLSK